MEKINAKIKELRSKEANFKDKDFIKEQVLENQRRIAKTKEDIAQIQSQIKGINSSKNNYK